MSPTTFNSAHVEQARGHRRCFAAIWIVAAVVFVGIIVLIVGLVCSLTDGICRPLAAPADHPEPMDGPIDDNNALQRLGRLSEGFIFNGTNIVNSTFGSILEENTCLEDNCVGYQAALYNDLRNGCTCFNEVECVQPLSDDSDIGFDELHSTFLYVRGTLPCAS